MFSTAEQPSRESLLERAKAVIPNGTQTLSKCPERYIKGVYPGYLIRAAGASVFDKDGKYTDYIASLGAVILGYNDPTVNTAVIHAISSSGPLLPLPHESEILTAERLKKHIPCAEKVKFYKTGSEATSAAVRVARAFTGKDRILTCGYHGWHDWSIAATNKLAGIPSASSNLVIKCEYNDLEQFALHLDKNDIAAVILEPVVYDVPEAHFLRKIIEAAHANGALVIFDEMVTGFRFALGGAQEYFGVTPDLACFGKAMGNGFPIAALVGRAEYMSVFERSDFFVSGTYGSDIVGLTAAKTVIDILSIGSFISDIWKKGETLMLGFNKTCLYLKLDGIYCIGYPCRSMFRFPTPGHRALFWQECIYGGVLFGYANFITAAHSFEAINDTLNVCERALRKVKEAWSDPISKLNGSIPVEVFQR